MRILFIILITLIFLPAMGQVSNGLSSRTDIPLPLHSFATTDELYWAYDAWPADPTRDARHTLWPAGDCFLVYPGGTSNIRYEKMREGISDFEKINVLRKATTAGNNTAMEYAMQAFDHFLLTLKTDIPYEKRDYSFQSIKKAIQQGQSLLDEWSAISF